MKIKGFRLEGYHKGVWVEKMFEDAEDADHFKFEQCDGNAKIRTVIQCSCGTEVICWGFTNTCPECEKDYNIWGQELAPRDQWGSETGESWHDCY